MLVPTDGVSHVSSDRMEFKRQKVSIFGSTGSVGTATLELIRNHPDKFQVEALVAGSNSRLLGEQINEFQPSRAVIVNSESWVDLKQVVRTDRTELLAGSSAAVEVAKSSEIDTVLAAITGFAGLETVYAALGAGKRVALANKESLVAGGQFVKELIEQHGGCVVPVDSEHSALFQALQGNSWRDVDKLILTASGGPFFRTPIEDFRKIKPEQALRHPNWSMGPKITIDSATLMNKALEFIEAYWLFGIALDRIDVVVHPQSIVHSMVEYCDGSVMAQLANHDMKGPIGYALAYPWGRITPVMNKLALRDYAQLEFCQLDNEKFPAIELAKRCLKQGGVASAVFNLANEIAVESFLAEKCRFDEMIPLIESAVDGYGESRCGTYSELCEFMSDLRIELRAKHS